MTVISIRIVSKIHNNMRSWVANNVEYVVKRYEWLISHFYSNISISITITLAILHKKYKRHTCKTTGNNALKYLLMVTTHL